MQPIVLRESASGREQALCGSARGSGIASIDLLRGLVMILMTLDHMRDFLGVPGVSQLTWLKQHPRPHLAGAFPRRVYLGWLVVLILMYPLCRW